MEEASTSADVDDKVKQEGGGRFHVDMDLIPAAHLSEDLEGLQGLDIGVFNQEDLEQGADSVDI